MFIQEKSGIKRFIMAWLCLSSWHGTVTRVKTQRWWLKSFHEWRRKFKDWLIKSVYRNHPTFLLNIAPITFFKRKIVVNKSCENLLFCLRYTFLFDWHAKMYFKHEMVTKGEIFTSCFNFDLNRSASKKKMCSKCLFLSIVKKRPPLVNDNERGP